MARLHARLLGGLEFNDEDGGELRLATRKARALLAFLIVEADKWHTRDQLAGLLWSDRQQTQARHSLTQALGAIRKLGQSADTSLIKADSERVRLSAAAIDSDVLSFRKNLKRNPNTAAECYDGPLLDGFVAPDEAFDQWLTAERASFHNVLCSALSRAVDQAEANNDLTAAISAATRLEALDPYAETVHRQLMRLYTATGNRSGAIRQYESCRQMLTNELGVKPSAETTALLEAIRSENETATDRQPNTETAVTISQPVKPLSRSDRPSIAVLPFEDHSTDADQEFLSDGIADDIIAGLSKFRSLFVIARRSTFTYKGQNKDIREIATELGVRYVVEGSVRRSGNRIRVTAQLIDAETGNHIWSDRYDRELEDIFVVQDTVSEAIIREIAPEISQAEIARARRTPPDNLDAWGTYQNGLSLHPSGSPEDFDSATALFDQAHSIDPNFVDALAMAAYMRLRKVYYFGEAHGDAILNEARDLLNRAMRLDPSNSICHSAMGRLHTICEEYRLAEQACRKAVELNPNSVIAHVEMAAAHTVQARSEDALREWDTIVSLSPTDPHMAAVHAGRARSLFQLARFEECVEQARAASNSPNPRYWADAYSVAALTMLGRTSEAEVAKQILFKRKPDFTLATLDQSRGLDVATMNDALRKAGVPE